MVATCDIRCYKWIRLFAVTVYLVVATANSSSSRSSSSSSGNNNIPNPNSNNNRLRHRYTADQEEPYHPHNPLWREEQAFTGERRGPPTTSTNKRRNYFSVDDVSSEKERTSRGGSIDMIDTSSSSSNSQQNWRRKWFPIDFRRQRGKLDIGFSNDDDSPFSNNNKIQKRRKRFPPRSTTTDLSPSSYDSSATSTTSAIPFSWNANKLIGPGDSTRRRQQIINTGTDTAAVRKNAQASISFDPSSLGALIAILCSTGSSLVSVYVGTLRLLGPMIIVKRCLTTVGYIFYDHYNGRYLRTTYNKRIRYLQEYDIIAAARATGRCVLQILCMLCTGRFVGFVLDRMPCVLKPTWVCHWWYGMVWLMSVSTIGWVCEEWGLNFVTRNNYIHHLLSIQPTQISSNDSHNSMRSKRKRKRDNILKVPWRFIQWMKDPEELVTKIIRVPHGDRYYYTTRKNTKNESKYPTNARGDNDSPIKLDTLLFPSTWKPLIVLTFLAVSRAICVSYSLSPSSSISSCRDHRYLIMRSFVVQETLYSEWYRVFVKERRIVLGAGISVVGLMCLLWSINSVANVDSIAAFLMIPTLIARLVSGWMNILLYYNRCISPRPDSFADT
ncbi:MAG: tryptophan-rich sensory protein [Bacillariaceae sp.]|jgi:tryptophan-rich sensory protein